LAGEQESERRERGARRARPPRGAPPAAPPPPTATRELPAPTFAPAGSEEPRVRRLWHRERGEV